MGTAALAHVRTAVRRAHLVDIENLVGTGLVTRAAVAAAARAYTDLGLVRPGDHVIVGCSPMVQLEVGLGWQGTHRLVVGHGHDGADRALLDVVAAERLADRFTEVVVASGDGIFADAVTVLRAQGLDVTVVSRREALSWRLYAAAGALPVEFPSAVARDGVTTPCDLRLAA